MKTDKKIKRVLVVNPFGIGDVLFTTPLIRAIKAANPQWRIHFICNKRTRPILEHNPYIDEIIVIEKDEYRDLLKSSKVDFVKKFLSLLAKVKTDHFELAIDLSLGSQYGFFLKLLGVKRRIGFDYKKRGRFLTDRIRIDGFRGSHIVEHYLRLLGPLNIKPHGSEIEMRVSEEDKRWASEQLALKGRDEDRTIVGIIPGGGASWGKDAGRKQWNPKNFAEIAKSLKGERGLRILLLGDDGDRQLCDQISSGIPGGVENFCGKTDLGRFAALLGSCKLVVTNDGGPLHVAVSQNVKTISIFGPVDDKVYGPYPPGDEHVVMTASGVDCRPCYEGFRVADCRDYRCLDRIAPSAVLDKAKELLSKAA
ncbi:MAG: glycosyltransferase family 9 protein [Candidatus Omnitrophica bacterium]|nr:glycosyltransferase family 9 protein [Candidatus Omnitrophota bacterium]